MRNYLMLVLPLVAWCTTAWASPGSLGAFPSTDFYEHWHLDVDTNGHGVRADTSVTAGITHGFGPGTDAPGGRNEVGFDYVVSAGGVVPAISSEDRLLFNAKTQLWSSEPRATRVVAGVWGVGSRNIFAPNYAYVTGSRRFALGRIHLGLAHSFAGNVAGVSVIAAPSGRADKTSIHLAYDRNLSSKLSFSVDWYSGRNAFTCSEPYLFYQVNEAAGFGLGVIHFNDPSVEPRNQADVYMEVNF